MDVNALLKALQTTLRFEQEMASRFGAPTPATAPPVRRDSGRESDHAFPYSSGVQREPETEVRNFYFTLPDSLSHPFFVTLARLSLSPSSSSLLHSLSLFLTPFSPLLPHSFPHHFTLFILTFSSRLKRSGG